MVTKRQIEKTAVYLLFSLFIQLFSNRNQMSLFSRKAYDKLIITTGKKVGCPCSLVSCSYFSTDRAQYQGKSAKFLMCACTRARTLLAVTFDLPGKIGIFSRKIEGDSARRVEGSLNDAINYAQKGCAMQI